MDGRKLHDLMDAQIDYSVGLWPNTSNFPGPKCDGYLGIVRFQQIQRVLFIFLQRKSKSYLLARVAYLLASWWTPVLHKTRSAPSFSFLSLSGEFVEARLKVRPAVLPSHLDSLFPIVGTTTINFDDRRSSFGSETYYVDFSHNGAQNNLHIKGGHEEASHSVSLLLLTLC